MAISLKKITGLLITIGVLLAIPAIAAAPSGADTFQLLASPFTGGDNTGDGGTGLADDLNYYYVGQSFTATMEIKSGGTDAANIIIDYDTAKTAASSLANGIYFPTWAGQSISGGQIKQTGFRLSGTSSGTGNFGSFTVTMFEPTAFDYGTGSPTSYDIDEGVIGDTTESNISLGGADILDDVEDFDFHVWADTVKPFAENPSPADTATGIAVETDFTFDLRDTLNGEGDNSGVGTGVSTTEPPGALTFNDGGGAVSYTAYDSFSCSGTWGTNLCEVTVNPPSPLGIVGDLRNFEYDTTYTVTVSDFEDLASGSQDQLGDANGPNVMDTKVFTFTTEADADAPFVNDETPTRASSGNSVSADVVIDIVDKHMPNISGVGVDSSTCSFNISSPSFPLITYDELDAEVSVVAIDYGYRFTINPASDFGQNETVSVSAFDCEDLAGNVMTTDNWTFTTADTDTPFVDQRDPANDAGADVSDNVLFHIKDDGSGVNLGGVVIFVNGVYYTDGGGAGSMTTTGTRITFADSLDFNGGNYFGDTTGVSGTAEDFTFLIDPEADFVANEAVPVLIYAEDLSGNLMERDVYAFTITSGAAQVCGNSSVEGNEVCDDGNTVGGDGCSANCLSDESCGNGMYDPGEECDDANLTNGDGCDNVCEFEQTGGGGGGSCPTPSPPASYDLTAPLISNIVVTVTSDTSVLVSWETNEASTSVVNFGLTNTYGLSESSSSLVQAHSVQLTSLTPGTLYHFRVQSSDPSGNTASSVDDTFSTTIDPPPQNVSNLSVQDANQSCALAWENPVAADLAGIHVLRCENAFPDTQADTDCVLIFDALGTAFVDTGIVNGTRYYYGVFAYDDANQFSSGALVSCIPQTEESVEEPPAEPTPEEPGVDEPATEEPVVDEPTPEEPGEEVPVVTPEEPGEVPTAPVAPVEDETDVRCGNAVCESGESPLSCPSDCPSASVPTTTVAQPISETEIEFHVGYGRITLSVQEDQTVSLLPGRPLSVQLLTRQISGPVDRVQLVFGAQTYNMSPNFSENTGDLTAALFGEQAYLAEITVPDVAASYLLAVSIFYTDGTAQTFPFVAQVVSEGYVFEHIDGTEARVSGATATLLEDYNGLNTWPATSYGQTNPQVTETDGTIGWYVPNGSYRVRVTKDGYQVSDSGRHIVTNNIMHPVLEMALLTAPTLEPPTDEVPDPAFVPVPGIAQEALDQVEEVLSVIRDIPGVKEAATISTPILAVSTLAVASVLASSFGLLPFLQYLFTAPFLLLWRRKRKGYGVVYNAFSKTPVDLAVVRLFDLSKNEATGGKLVATRVTDVHGRYFLLVQPGTYRLSVMKKGFDFPSDYLKKKREDASFVDLYHGEPISVTEKDALLTPNIPIDPSQAGAERAPAKIQRIMLLRKLQHVLALIGIIASAAFAIIQPTPFTISMVAVQVILYLLVRRLAKPRKPKSWGIVYDKNTNKPLSGVVVRVFENKYNRLLETQVTDSKGRYAFLLGQNTFYTSYVKDGYGSMEVRPIDYTAQKEPDEFAMDVNMFHEDSGA